MSYSVSPATAAILPSLGVTVFAYIPAYSVERDGSEWVVIGSDGRIRSSASVLTTRCAAESWARQLFDS